MLLCFRKVVKFFHAIYLSDTKRNTVVVPKLADVVAGRRVANPEAVSNLLVAGSPFENEGEHFLAGLRIDGFLVCQG
jgi:hypothetical protein